MFAFKWLISINLTTAESIENVRPAASRAYGVVTNCGGDGDRGPYKGRREKERGGEKNDRIIRTAGGTAGRRRHVVTWRRLYSLGTRNRYRRSVKFTMHSYVGPECVCGERQGRTDWDASAFQLHVRRSLAQSVDSFPETIPAPLNPEVRGRVVKTCENDVKTVRCLGGKTWMGDDDSELKWEFRK